MTQDSQTYSDMLRKLDELIAQLQDPNLDLDRVVEKTEAGYELIKSMRIRLDETRTRVEKLQLEQESAGEPTT